MTLVKTDHPRRIDHVINYFGEQRDGVSSDPSPHGNTAALPYRLAEHLGQR